MNDKLQYATMLEIPVNTCSVTFEQQKKKKRSKKKVDADAVKQELVSKVNLQMEENEDLENSEPLKESENLSLEMDKEIESENLTATVSCKQENKKGKFKLGVIGVQFIIIGILVATIFLTNALYTDSGINVFLREVFGTNQTSQVDNRVYGEFSPVISLDDGANINYADGVITLSGEGSVYAPCDGVVTSIVKGEDGKYSIEISHSTNFKSVLAGLDYAYIGLNDSVFYNIPVGYINAEATMCFTQSDGSVISDYQIIEDSVVWAE